MSTLWQDLRFAARTFGRAPGFFALAAIVLAIGIGANSAIFSLVDAALLRAFPFADPARLAMLWEKPPGFDHNRVSPLNLVDWTEQNQVFSSMAGVVSSGRTLTTAEGGAEHIPGQLVTQQFFDLLGVKPFAGRTFSALGRSGVNIIAIAQGSSEYNVSFVVEASAMREAVAVVHDEFKLHEVAQS